MIGIGVFLIGIGNQSWNVFQRTPTDCVFWPPIFFSFFCEPSAYHSLVLAIPLKLEVNQYL